MKYENKYFRFDIPKKFNLRKDFAAFCFSCLYKAVMNLCKPKNIMQKKYKISICAIFKNESLYLREWIEYHKIVGIEHFYLYNNNSEDDYDSVLASYIADGIVTLIQWPMTQGQTQAYNDCIENYAHETEWLSFIDIDEFIYPNKTENVYDFLRPFQKNRPVVLAYWKCFGADGKIARDMNSLVIESFTKCREKYSTVSKIFYNTAYSFDKNDRHNTALHHTAWGKYKNTALPPVNVYDKVCVLGRNPVPKNAVPAHFPLQINHYVTKSYQEYVDKTSKGDVYFKVNPHGEEHFLRNERINYKSQDFQIWEYLVRLKLAMEKEV